MSLNAEQSNLIYIKRGFGAKRFKFFSGYKQHTDLCFERRYLTIKAGEKSTVWILRRLL